MQDELKLKEFNNLAICCWLLAAGIWQNLHLIFNFYNKDGIMDNRLTKN
jgi:hypothetical protein